MISARQHFPDQVPVYVKSDLYLHGVESGAYKSDLYDDTIYVSTEYGYHHVMMNEIMSLLGHLICQLLRLFAVDFDLIAIFGLTALFFGGFALYGRFTKTDLSRLRPLLIGGLIFLLVAGVLSLFIDMTAMERLICMAGIVIFLCCTAYDNQKIKANYQFFYHDAVMLQKASIYSALQLYLDFLNLFLYLLRFLGRSKN